MPKLDNTVVIITGASSGIGEATARELADAGAKLMLTARREDRLKSLADDLGGECAFMKGDVTNRDDMESLAKATIDKFGRIDALVNNAGIMPLSFIGKDHVDEWEKMVDVNIKGVLFALHAVLPHMIERESGHIVNISSIAGHKVFPAAAVYCGTKFFVRALSEGIRAELAGKLRVTNISPGAIATELTDSITDEDVKANMSNVFKIAVDPSCIARGIRFALEEPSDVSVNEMIIRPTQQQM